MNGEIVDIESRREAKEYASALAEFERDPAAQEFIRRYEIGKTSLPDLLEIAFWRGWESRRPR